MTSRAEFVTWFNSLKREDQIDIWYESEALSRVEIEKALKAGKLAEAQLTYVTMVLVGTVTTDDREHPAWSGASYKALEVVTDLRLVKEALAASRCPHEEDSPP